MRRGSTLLAAVLTGLVFTAALSAPLSALANTSGTPTPPPAPTAPAIPAPPSDRPIRIGLGRSLANAEVSAAGGLLVIAGGQVQFETTTAVVKLAEGKLQIQGITAPLTGPVRLVPKAAAPGAPNYITYKSRPYRGEVELAVIGGAKLSLINLINLEEYLLGVVPNEMPSAWPLEALKAQAVAARTYAVTNMGKQKADGFDLVDNFNDQAYGGVKAETPRTSEAVLSTRGMVLTYGGRPVPAYYHSSSGGHTENNEHIWTGGVPLAYLRGVKDYDNVPAYENIRGNPWLSWSYQYTPAEFAEKLKKANYNVGSLAAILPGPAGASGRPTRWTVEGSQGQVTLTMLRMREVLGLPAPSRTIELKSEAAPAPPPPPPPAPVYVVGAGGSVSQRQVAGSYVVSAGGTVSQRPAGPASATGTGSVAMVGQSPPAPPPEPPEPPKPALVTITGGGNGHGVGMSQWGAHGLALQGKSYTEILTHFYTGTKVETR